MPRADPDSTAAAIRQTRPFRSPAEEAFVALFLAADAVQEPLTRLLVRHGTTPQQYNVLRILRGAGAQGLPTLEIAARMIVKTPGITRLVDRLVRQGLVSRTRSTADRRQVVCRVTPQGLELLKRLERPVARQDDRAFSMLSEREVRTLIRLLNRVRTGQE